MELSFLCRYDHGEPPVFFEDGRCRHVLKLINNSLALLHEIVSDDPADPRHRGKVGECLLVRESPEPLQVLDQCGAVPRLPALVRGCRF